LALALEGDYFFLDQLKHTILFMNRHQFAIDLSLTHEHPIIDEGVACTHHFVLSKLMGFVRFQVNKNELLKVFKFTVEFRFLFRFDELKQKTVARWAHYRQEPFEFDDARNFDLLKRIPIVNKENFKNQCPFVDSNQEAIADLLRHGGVKSVDVTVDLGALKFEPSSCFTAQFIIRLFLGVH
jgi:hypothetical protein